jgi:hypothetical protein
LILRRSSDAKRIAAAAASLGRIELAAAGSRLTIIPALGGRIATMELGDRQWLWTSDVLAWQPPGAASRADDASYVQTADSGGYDECFPTVAPCTLPGNVRGFGGVTLPDHGELWSQRPEIDVRSPSGSPSATCIWRGVRMPYEFRRQVTIGPEGEIIMRYAATNTGRDRMPFIWSPQPLLPLTAQTHITLPPNAKTRVYAQENIDLFGAGADHLWPKLQGQKGRVDLSHPDSVARKYVCKLFVDMPSGHAAVQEGNSRLDVEFDAHEIPNFGLWINKRGWTPFKRGKAYQNFSFAPCIGAPDSLSDALGEWKSAVWLEPGARREWTVTWRGRG